MLRVEVSEDGQGALPPFDLEGDFAIGSAESARVRLPAGAAIQAEHVRVEAGRWRALAPILVDGAAREAGDIGAGVTLAIGSYRIKLAPAPAGSKAAPPQRTESLARELLRNLLGTGAAPSLEIERGPAAGAKRSLAPPESTLVIGRGDAAGWIIDDDDLSRTHAEIRRGWDGIHIADLGSKNGTHVDGERIAGDGVLLSDGAQIELGNVVMRFRDPAENHLRGDVPPPTKKTPPPKATPSRSSSSAEAARDQRPVNASSLPFYVAVAIMLAALAGLVWLLAS